MKRAVMMSAAMVGAAILGAVMVLATLGGCRARHLGPDTGDSYRAAVAAQRDSAAGAPAAMDADDARATMATHRGEGAGAKRGGAASGAAAASVTTSTSVSGGGSWPGATGNIRLDAK